MQRSTLFGLTLACLFGFNSAASAGHGKHHNGKHHHNDHHHNNNHHNDHHDDDDHDDDDDDHHGQPQRPIPLDPGHGDGQETGPVVRPTPDQYVWIPGHWERPRAPATGDFIWVPGQWKRKLGQPKSTQTGPTIRDHRTPVTSNNASGVIVRDHRTPTGPVIRDHRTPSGTVVRDHRK